MKYEQKRYKACNLTTLVHIFNVEHECIVGNLD